MNCTSGLVLLCFSFSEAVKNQKLFNKYLSRRFLSDLIELQKRIDQLVDENLTLNAIAGTQQAVTEEAHRTAKRVENHMRQELERLKLDFDTGERNRAFLSERVNALEVSIPERLRTFYCK